MLDMLPYGWEGYLDEWPTHSLETALDTFMALRRKGIMAHPWS